MRDDDWAAQYRKEDTRWTIFAVVVCAFYVAAVLILPRWMYG